MYNNNNVKEKKKRKNQVKLRYVTYDIRFVGSNMRPKSQTKVADILQKMVEGICIKCCALEKLNQFCRMMYRT